MTKLGGGETAVPSLPPTVSPSLLLPGALTAASLGELI